MMRAAIRDGALPLNPGSAARRPAMVARGCPAGGNRCGGEPSATAVQLPEARENLSFSRNWHQRCCIAGTVRRIVALDWRVDADYENGDLPGMPIKFSASVTLSRKNPVTGKLRYMPNVKFDIIGLDRVQFGLTILDDADWPLNHGEEQRAHFTMLRNADLDADLFVKLADSIRAGTAFSLMEGAFVVGSGIVRTIEERTHK